MTFRGWLASLRPTSKYVAVFLIVMFGVFIILTVYDDHVSLVASGRNLNTDNQNVRKERDERKKKFEDADRKLNEKATPKTTSGHLPIAATPEIKAFRREVGTDSDGLIRTEFTLVSNVVISPPLTIEMDFDSPIVYLGSTPSPTPAALLGGGDRWNGTHGFATIPNTGISPNLTWIVTVKSRAAVNLISRPRPRTGY